LLPLLTVLGACTFANPLFDVPEGTDDGSLDEDEVGEDELGEDEIGGTGESAEDGGTCPLPAPEGQPLEIRMAGQCPPAAYDHWVRVGFHEDASTFTGSICGTLETCIDLDEICAEGQPVSFTVAPLPLQTMFGAQACIHIRAWREFQVEGCRYENVALWNSTDPAPFLVARSRDDIPLSLDGNLLEDLNPVLEVDEVCDCDEYPDACCDGVEPTQYTFNLPGQDPIKVGESVPLTLVDDAEFFALEAFRAGDCEDRVVTSWAVVSPF